MMLSAGIYHNLLICHFHCILCVHPMSLISTCFMRSIIPFLQRCNSCNFCIYVVTRTSMQSSLHDVADFCDSHFCQVCSCNIVMPCKPAAIMSSMHNLEMFTKDVLLYMLFSIHPCPCFHLWHAVPCCYLALRLL